jgi:hypothetical protein
MYNLHIEWLKVKVEYMKNLKFEFWFVIEMNGNMGSREYSRELITQAYIKYSYQKEKKIFLRFVGNDVVNSKFRSISVCWTHIKTHKFPKETY